MGPGSQTRITWIICRADVDKAYVWALHSSVTGAIKVKGKINSWRTELLNKMSFRNDKTAASSLHPRGLPISTETHRGN